MSATTSFVQLIERVRLGDQEAAAELVRLYEPAIRRMARVRLVDPRLRSLLDSMDIVQSVFSSFFERMGRGQFQLDKPEQLLGLLVNMSQRKVADVARRQGAGRRDYRRVSAKSPVEAVAGTNSPSAEAEERDLEQEFRKRLHPEERALADQRARGMEWDQISATCGESGEALRKKLARAVKRVSQELGLDEIGRE